MNAGRLLMKPACGFGVLALLLLGGLSLGTRRRADERAGQLVEAASSRRLEEEPIDSAPEQTPAKMFQEYLRDIFDVPLPPAGPIAGIIGGTWIAEGPSPALRGQAENVPGPNPVSGAVHRIAPHPSDPNILYIGAVNGGIWRTTNATAINPHWTPLTDQLLSLSTGALEFDPTDGTNQTLVAGIGRFSSFGGSGGPQVGLLRTTDGGNTWTQLGQKDLANRNIVALGPRGSIILVAVSGGTGTGMYRSTDGGASFKLISGMNGLDTGPVFDLASDPSNPMRFYAGLRGTRRAVFRSDDAGAMWTNVTDAAMGALIVGTTNNVKLAVSAAPGNSVYAGIVNSSRLAGVFRSANLGANWIAMDLPQTLDRTARINNATNAAPIVVTSATAHGLTNGDRVRVAGVTGNPAANGDFAITVVNNTQFSLQGTTGNGAYISGGTWTAIVGIHPGGQGGTHFSFAPDPTNPNLVYIAGDRQGFTGMDSQLGAGTFSGRLFRGDTRIPAGGPGVIPSPQWAPLTHSGTASKSSPHADSRDMEFDSNGNLIESDDGGIYRRTNPQGNLGDWFSVVGDLQVMEFHDIAYDTNSDIIMGGAQDNGTSQQMAAGATTWNAVILGDGGDVKVDVDTFTLAGMRRSIRYSSSQNLGGFRRQVFDAANTQIGNSVTLIPAGGLPGFVNQFVTPIAVNAIPPPVGQSTRLVIGGGTDRGATPPIVSGAVYEANNAGIAANAAAVNWTQVPTGSGFGAVNGNALAYGGRRGGVDNPDVLYVGSGNRVFVRTAAGGTLAPTAALPPGAGTIVDIALDPQDWMIAFALDTSHVYQTTEAGATWIDITGDLNKQTMQFRTSQYIPGPGPGTDKMVIGTNEGMFISFGPPFGSWLKLGDGLPNAPVWDLVYDVPHDLLVAGTMGRGAWSLVGISRLTNVNDELRRRAVIRQ